MLATSDLVFGKGGKATEVLRAWWRRLESDRGGRAELRRSATPVEVAFVPIYHELVHELMAIDRPISRERLAALAALVACVKTDTGDGPSLASQMAAPRSAAGTARVSGLRFRRILAVGDADLPGLYSQLKRALSLLDDSVNLADLSRSVYWWNDSTKKRWAYDYYAAAPSEK